MTHFESKQEKSLKAASGHKENPVSATLPHPPSAEKESIAPSHVTSKPEEGLKITLRNPMSSTTLVGTQVPQSKVPPQPASSITLSRDVGNDRNISRPKIDQPVQPQAMPVSNHSQQTSPSTSPRGQQSHNITGHENISRPRIDQPVPHRGLPVINHSQQTSSSTSPRGQQSHDMTGHNNISRPRADQPVPHQAQPVFNHSPHPSPSSSPRGQQPLSQKPPLVPSPEQQGLQLLAMELRYQQQIAAGPSPEQRIQKLILHNELLSNTAKNSATVTNHDAQTICSLLIDKNLTALKLRGKLKDAERLVLPKTKDFDGSSEDKKREVESIILGEPCRDPLSLELAMLLRSNLSSEKDIRSTANQSHSPSLQSEMAQTALARESSSIAAREVEDIEEYFQTNQTTDTRKLRQQKSRKAISSQQRKRRRLNKIQKTAAEKKKQNTQPAQVIQKNNDLPIVKLLAFLSIVFRAAKKKIWK